MFFPFKVIRISNKFWSRFGLNLLKLAHLLALPRISEVPFLPSWIESLAVASHPLQPD